MFNKSLVLSLSIFMILMVFISFIKNYTRNIEKNIEQLNMEISILQKDLLNAEIDFIYLSSPEKLLTLNKKSYSNYDFSRIFLSTEEFINFSSKQSKN